MKKNRVVEVERYSPTVKEGLSDNQVQERIKQGKVNKLLTKTSKSYFQIVLSNTFTFFNMLCFIICGVLISIGSWTNILFIFIFLANLFIGIIQECKSKHTVDKISLLTSPKAIVIRDGKRIEIPVEQIVLDDIVVFSAGSQISADCILLEGNVEVNENLLTGESDSIKKESGATLYSGSYVVSGECFARADKIGEESYMTTLIKKAKHVKKSRSEIFDTLNKIIKFIGIIIIPLAVFTFLDHYVWGNDTLYKSIEYTSGSMLGMIPAGMFLLTSVALAVGVIKLASKRTLVQDLYSIEMLARTDILCLDKTGTLTDGNMKFNTLLLQNKYTKEQVTQILQKYMSNLKNVNFTSQAIIDEFGKTDFKAHSVLEFSSERKYSAVQFDKNTTYILGASEFVGAKITENMKKQIDEYTNKGLRVLVLAKSDKPLTKDGAAKGGEVVAILVIEDTIRKDAIEVIKWFEQNDVEVKIISGDNANAVSKISKLVGLKNSEKFISLDGLTDEQVIDAANKYTVFGRVKPEQKSLLIKAMKQDGEKKVAMTGDGVNDILALKEADCSIAMASGSEATRSASNLVMLDSNFSSMPQVVAEGRRVINNISKSSALFLMKTLFTILMTIICLFTAFGYPFEPKHLLLLETVFVGIPSFFLALQPNNEKVVGTFAGNLIGKAIPAGIVLTLNVSLSYIFIAIMGINDIEVLRTLASFVLTFSGAMILLKLCMPLNAYRGSLWAVMMVLGILAIILFGGDYALFNFFGYSPLPTSCIIFMSVMVAVSYFAYVGLNAVTDIVLKKIEQNKAQKRELMHTETTDNLK